MSLPIFLQDQKFLQEVDKLRIKQQFIKITVLDWNEDPLEEVQGVVISGNVNLDGNSSMRRTATLSLFAEEKENNLANIDNLFAINKKCKLEIGIVNSVSNLLIDTTDEKGDPFVKVINYKELYGDIIWFPLGVYVMFNPSVAHSLTGVTISMNLKDKMCLLNGDLGGQIHSAVDFANQDELVDADSTSLQQNPTLVYNIIQEVVHHWGNEKLDKIIISQVPLKIKQVVKWIGSEPAYLVEDWNNPMLCTSMDQAKNWNENATIKVIEPGYDAGYFYTSFTYPGQLVCNAGETVTSVLDKIIGILGNYQYFYDVEGNFRFQQKQNYLNMTNTAYWAKEERKDQTGFLPIDNYEMDISRLSKPVYQFINNNYITAHNNTLNYNNIKNDFVVWGSRPVASGSSERIGCRFHLAIDKKPKLNKHSIMLYKDSFEVVRGAHYSQVMEIEVNQNGVPAEETFLFPAANEENKKGKVFKIIKDRQAIDWREEIYYQMLEDQYIGTGNNTELNNTYFQYYAELKEQFPKIFDLENQMWTVDIQKHPDKINYYLDFIDDNSLLGQYSVNNIGRRSKILADNNEGINCVFEPQIPDVVFLQMGNVENIKDRQRLGNIGQTYTQIQSYLMPLLSVGGSLNSCFEKIKDLLYQYTNMNNTISITALPIYYLQPNTRITVEDDPAGIYGDYIIQSISLPLDISSTMTINASKALQKI